jgi:hypothetical protein
MAQADLVAVVEQFLAEPLAADFCAVHLVLEQFNYRAHEYQTIPIPDRVRSAATLRQVADAFGVEAAALATVNDWIWSDPDHRVDEILQKDDKVNIPDEDFVPILAARFAAEALVSPTLPANRRSWVIQRLAPMALSNTTALNTVLGRLMLSTLDRPAALPAVLASLRMPAPQLPMPRAVDPVGT